MLATLSPQTDGQRLKNNVLQEVCEYATLPFVWTAILRRMFSNVYRQAGVRLTYGLRAVAHGPTAWLIIRAGIAFDSVRQCILPRGRTVSTRKNLNLLFTGGAVTPARA